MQFPDPSGALRAPLSPNYKLTNHPTLPSFLPFPSALPAASRFLPGSRRVDATNEGCILYKRTAADVDHTVEISKSNAARQGNSGLEDMDGRRDARGVSSCGCSRQAGRGEWEAPSREGGVEQAAEKEQGTRLSTMQTQAPVDGCRRASRSR